MPSLINRTTKYKSMTIAAFTGKHPAPGYGLLDCGRTICPEQLLIEDDFFNALRQYSRPVHPSPENIALPDIIEVNLHGANHLESDHTAMRFRDSLHMPELLDRAPYAVASFAQNVDKNHSRADLFVAKEFLGRSVWLCVYSA